MARDKRGRFTLYKDGTAVRSGVDEGTLEVWSATHPDIEDRDVIQVAFKERGSAHWAGLGERGYSGTRFQVWRGRMRAAGVFEGERLAEFPMRRPPGVPKELVTYLLGLPVAEPSESREEEV